MNISARAYWSGMHLLVALAEEGVHNVHANSIVNGIWWCWGWLESMLMLWVECCVISLRGAAISV